jgi:hypothetical protein
MISKKNSIDLLDELELFIGKTQFLQKPNFRRSAVCRDCQNEKFCPLAFWKILSSKGGYEGNYYQKS